MPKHLSNFSEDNLRWEVGLFPVTHTDEVGGDIGDIAAGSADGESGAGAGGKEVSGGGVAQ